MHRTGTHAKLSVQRYEQKESYIVRDEQPASRRHLRRKQHEMSMTDLLAKKDATPV
jgi:hypothetical protein